MCVLVLRQWLENCYYGTHTHTHTHIQTCYYLFFKNSKGSLKRQLQNLLSIGKGRTCYWGSNIYTEYFLLMRSPSSNWEGMLFSSGALVSWTGGQNGLKLGEGNVGSLPGIFYKWERERRLTPSRLLFMPCKGITGQIWYIQWEKKKENSSFNSCTAMEDEIFKAV